MEKKSVATVWLEGCSGCHMSLLDLDEALIPILGQINLTVSPITDFKDYDFGKVDLGIVEGAAGNHEHLEIVHRLRTACGAMMALGDCAVFGGINTLRNFILRRDILNGGYVEAKGLSNSGIPDDPELPRLLDKVLPINAVAPVEIYVPGCPPAPEAIAYALTEVLNGRIPVLPPELLHFD